MKKMTVTLLCCLVLSGCTATTGFVYQDTAPITSETKGSKEGSATCRRILGFNTGDCSIGGAMADGHITQPYTVTYENRNLWIYKSNTTIVTGE